MRYLINSMSELTDKIFQDDDAVPVTGTIMTTATMLGLLLHLVIKFINFVSL